VSEGFLVWCAASLLAVGTTIAIPLRVAKEEWLGECFLVVQISTQRSAKQCNQNKAEPATGKYSFGFRKMQNGQM